MSRTYRRKNTPWNYKWELRDYGYEKSKYGGFFFTSRLITPENPEYTKRINEYHSDKDRYGNAVPHWFVNLYCEKPMRQKTKRNISKWLKNPDDEDLLIPEFIKDAGWKYY